jgi:hypothetical protein
MSRTLFHVLVFVAIFEIASGSIFHTNTIPHSRRRMNEPADHSSSKAINIQTYALWEPSLISQTLQEWAKHYPEFVRVTTAQDAYGLPRAGTADDCPFDQGGDGCLNYILMLQDFVMHPEESESSRRLPEVL